MVNNWRKRLFLLGTLLIAVLMSGCLTMPITRIQGELIGRVSNSKDETPWTNVSVTFTPLGGGASFGVITNEDGMYCFPKVTAGNYRATFTLADETVIAQEEVLVPLSFKDGSQRMDFSFPPRRLWFYEGESLYNVTCSGARWDVQDMGWFEEPWQPWAPLNWSGGHQLWMHDAVIGGWVEGTFRVPAGEPERPFALIVTFTTAVNYGIVELSIDGELVGTWDSYSPQIGMTRVDVGQVDLCEGEHRLRMTIIGNQETFPDGIGAGIDCFELIETL